MTDGERRRDAVDLAGAFGLRRFALRYSEAPDFVGFPLCPEVYSGNRIIDKRWNYEWDLLIAEVLQIEELLFDGDLEFGLELLAKLPLRCSETGREERKDWPPGVYLHFLRRLATGDSAQTVYDDLRQVEARLQQPAAYLESLRRQLETCLVPPSVDVAVSRRPSEKKTKAFPAWERRDKWLLIGNQAGEKGMLAFDGEVLESLRPQVFKLLCRLLGKTNQLTLKEALDIELISTKSAKKAVGTFKKLIGRANEAFGFLGATKEEGPLHYREGVCVSTVEITHVPSTSHLRKKLR